MIAFPNIQPEIFSLTILGIEIALRWYALSYVIGFIVAVFVINYFNTRPALWKHRTAPFDEGQVDGFVTYLILGVIIGGRLGYVIFYNFNYYVNNPSEILQVWNGGMSFHGGFLGVVFVTLVFCRRNGILLWSCADLLAIASGPGILLGRTANFINAELWGRPTDLPWGVIFPGERAQNCPDVIGACARHPSQLYEALLEGLLPFVLLVALAQFGILRRPGLATSIFLMCYGFGRYIVEFFRVPDPQFFSDTNPWGFAYVFGDLGVTMGQLLSLPMILFGLILLVVSMREPKRR